MIKSVMKYISITALLFSLLLVFAAPSATAALADGHSKFLGNIIAGSIPSNFRAYWNQVTPENGTKWGSIEATRDVMNWSNADMIYNYAQSNGIPFKFHTLIWGNQAPSWINNLPANEQRAEVLEWIQAAGQRYPNTAFVDVVNEPLHAPPAFRNALGGAGATGWDWVVWAFERAREAFPNAKLHLNDYGIISNPQAADQYIEIINILKARGLIDGIGIQCHFFNMDTVSVSTMTTVLNKLAATGLPIYITELDISGDDQTQLQRYQQKFPVLWEHPAVKGVTLWGYIVGQTWADNTGLIHPNGQARPALQWLKRYFAEQHGGLIALKANANGKYVAAENAGSDPLVADRDSIGYWEAFTLIHNPDGTVSLRSYANNLYVSADLNNNGRLIARQTYIGYWEKFQMIQNSDGTVSFRAIANNKYVTADLNLSTPRLVADRDVLDIWEKFTIHPVPW